MKKHMTVLAAVIAALAAPAFAQEWSVDGASLVSQMRTLAEARALRAAAKPAHQPEALRALLDLVERTAKAGKTPVVMFDLDDTLIDTAYRHIAILREFARRPDVQRRFPDEARRLGAIQYKDVRYDLADTIKALGVDPASAVVPELKAFWLARFFENDYLLNDRANAGGVDFVKETVRRGGVAVYLTGRWNDMRPGTEQSMEAMGYPRADGRKVVLMMKPTKAQTDLDFKKIAFEDIARLGEVVGGFENEPANVNAYQQRYKTGIYIFLDTRHSTTPTVPLPTIAWVPDFKY